MLSVCRRFVTTLRSGSPSWGDVHADARIADSTDDGANVIQWPWTEGDNGGSQQLWTFDSV